MPGHETFNTSLGNVHSVRRTSQPLYFTTMSWLAGLAQGKEPPPYKDTSTDKVPDPSIPDRMVSNKAANQPFLAYVFTVDSLTLCSLLTLCLTKIQGVPSKSGGITCRLAGEEKGAWWKDRPRRKSRTSWTRPYRGRRGWNSGPPQNYCYPFDLCSPCWEVLYRELYLGI